MASRGHQTQVLLTDPFTSAQWLLRRSYDVTLLFVADDRRGWERQRKDNSEGENETDMLEATTASSTRRKRQMFRVASETMGDSL